MNYIQKVKKEDFKEFIENYLNKDLTFIKATKQTFGVEIKFCYNKNYSQMHSMMVSDYHISSNSGVWISKLWKAFMYEKFGEQYLKDFEDFYLTDFKNSYKRQYDEFVERIKSDYKDKENDIKRQVKEVKKIAEKKNQGAEK